MSASGLPGKRVEANRAGMKATTCCGNFESTVEPVDEGCTTKYNTPPETAVLRSQRVRRVITKRTIIVVVVLGSLAAWLASAATQGVRPVRVVATPPAP